MNSSLLPTRSYQLSSKPLANRDEFRIYAAPICVARPSLACGAEARGITSLAAVQPIHVDAWIEELGSTHSVPTGKQRLAGIRTLFDWLVVGQVVRHDPAASVRGPRHVVRRGKTPVLDPAEARQLLDAIDITKPVGLRDRALIGLMVYSWRGALAQGRESLHPEPPALGAPA